LSLSALSSESKSRGFRITFSDLVRMMHFSFDALFWL